MTEARLFDYFRSSAAYRVRIALNLKGVTWESIPIDLRSGAQSSPDYRARNPQGLVPLLEVDGLALSQSLAIIDYLEATRPAPSLFPSGAADRAHVLALALVIACDIHPLNNLRVLRYLAGPLAHPEEERNVWYHHWLREGLGALEAMARPRAGRFLFGDTPTVADVFLVPQLFNARRLQFPLDDYPLLVSADAEAARLDAFATAHPSRFSDGA